MYSLKGSCIVQTFALAASNDSGSKRTRIRRSKEERKSMAESFIKRYQSLNGGNFPSLNLAHKEVGGSFYTVREIVREIIQENRVLGPARLDSKEQEGGDNLEQQYPLGSISTGPQNHLLESVNGNVTDSNDEGALDVDPSFHCNQQYANYQSLDDVVFVDGSSEIGPPIEKISKTQTIEMSYGSNNSVVGDISAVESQIDGMSKELYELNGTVVNRTSAGDNQIDDITSVSVVLNESDMGKASASSQSLELNETVVREPGDLDDLSEKFDDLEVTVADSPSTTATGIEATDEMCKWSQKLLGKEFLVSETSDGDTEYKVGVDGNLCSPTPEVHDESFPVQPVIEEMNGVNKTSVGSGHVEQSSMEIRPEEVNLGYNDSAEFGSSSHQNSSVMLNEEATTVQNGEMSENKASKMVLNFSDQSEETRETMFREGDTVITQDRMETDLPSARLEQSKTIARVEPETAVDEIHGKNLKGFNENRATAAEAAFTKPTMGEDAKRIVKQNGSVAQGKTPPLDRINLESWEGTTERTRGQETNPLLAFVKAVVNAFVKFWSE